MTGLTQPSWNWKGKGDVFLAYGIRDQLRSTLSVSPRYCPLGVCLANKKPDEAKTLPFPLIDEEIYEPPQDAEDGKLETPP